MHTTSQSETNQIVNMSNKHSGIQNSDTWNSFGKNMFENQSRSLRTVQIFF